MDITKPDNDLMKLNDIFRSKVYKLLELAKTNWLNIWIFEAWRSPERQKYLYSIWRTIQLNKKPVTWRLNSNHIVWKAVDIIFYKNWKITWEWDYKKLIGLAKTIWIKNLSPIEVCHFEL